MHYDPKCPEDHKCKRVCVSSSCTIANPFICSSCPNRHKGEFCEIIAYQQLINQFRRLNGTYTNAMLRYQERIDNIFDELMSGLKRHFVLFREEIESLNIHPRVQDIYIFLRKHQEHSLNASHLNKAYKTVPQKPYSIKIKDLLTLKMQENNIRILQSHLLNNLPPFYSLSAQLEQQPEEIERNNMIGFIEDKYLVKRKDFQGLFNEYFSFFEENLKKPIYNVQLLYRASQHGFEASAFHKKCDGVPNTVTLAKTEYGNIVIGFSYFPWSSPNRWQYHVDHKGECFLLSPHKLLKSRKYIPLKSKFAIGMHKEYGPAFGDDFVIYNKAHHSKGCWSNFPDVYNSKTKPPLHDEETIKAFVGVSDHFEKFNLVEWEVYKISLSADQEMEREYMVEYRKIP